jgi:hypothetical protein
VVSSDAPRAAVWTAAVWTAIEAVSGSAEIRDICLNSQPVMRTVSDVLELQTRYTIGDRTSPQGTPKA